jgi:GntR family transcriptional regulator/MocR family aminotransferase
MEPSFELPISIPPRGSRDRQRALHRQLRAAIIEGRLKPGLRLPPTREFAAAYKVSRNIVVMTYDLLLSEGYLATRRGSGTYVADLVPRLPERKSPLNPSRGDKRLADFWRHPPVIMTPHQNIEARYDFHLGVPDRSLFPFDVWRRFATRALRAASKSPAGYYEDPQGRAALREAIAKHVSFARAVACRAEDIVVTTGAQQAFDLIARVLVTPGKTVVALENPGYPPIRALLQAAGAKLAYVPVDEEGLIVEKIPARAQMICVTPSHQFPLGVAMSSRRRAALLELAQARGAVVVEDDYDAEFRFSARPLDALQTLDRAESVFYVGTFSKSLFPEIRLGFVVAPPWARGAIIAAKQCADWHCAALAQETLTAFIAEGQMAKHVRKMRNIYAERRKWMLEILHAEFKGVLRPVESSAGLHIAALTSPGIDADALVKRALSESVRLYSLSRFYADKPAGKGLVMGYGALNTRAIKEGLLRLRKVVP